MFTTTYKSRKHWVRLEDQIVETANISIVRYHKHNDQTWVYYDNGQSSYLYGNHLDSIWKAMSQRGGESK